MKRFWVALLAVAMVAGFAMSASAADVKFSGSYYVLGATANDWQLREEDRTTASFFAQRLRVGTDFKVAEGLTLTTRFDALEGRWGQWGNAEEKRTWGYTDDNNFDSRNISFDRVYVDFAIPKGKFRVGRAATGNWGTLFANSDLDSEQIRYFGYFGNFDVGVIFEKLSESVGNANWTAGNREADADTDRYHVYGIYKWKEGTAGVKFVYTRTSASSGLTNLAGQDIGWDQKFYTIQPYFQATFGPVFVEGELNYYTGEARHWEDNSVSGDDIDLEGWNAYLHAKVNAGPAYFGGLYAYVSGQDPNEDDFNNGGTGGLIWNPCLILWNQYSNRWAGRLGTGNGATYGAGSGQEMTNAHLFQVYAGFNPAPKWNVQGSVSYAIADHTSPTNGDFVTDYVDHKYGTEADVTVSYKIYDNLTYTVGFGYLWAGDYWKAATDNADVEDTYLLLNKLDLTF